MNKFLYENFLKTSIMIRINARVKGVGLVEGVLKYVSKNSIVISDVTIGKIVSNHMDELRVYFDDVLTFYKIESITLDDLTIEELSDLSQITDLRCKDEIEAKIQAAKKHDEKNVFNESKHEHKNTGASPQSLSCQSFQENEILHSRLHEPYEEEKNIDSDLKYKLDKEKEINDLKETINNLHDSKNMWSLVGDFLKTKINDDDKHKKNTSVQDMQVNNSIHQMNTKECKHEDNLPKGKNNINRKADVLNKLEKISVGGKTHSSTKTIVMSSNRIGLKTVINNIITNFKKNNRELEFGVWDNKNNLLNTSN